MCVISTFACRVLCSALLLSVTFFLVIVDAPAAETGRGDGSAGASRGLSRALSGTGVNPLLEPGFSTRRVSARLRKRVLILNAHLAACFPAFGQENAVKTANDSPQPERGVPPPPSRTRGPSFAPPPRPSFSGPTTPVVWKTGVLLVFATVHKNLSTPAVFFFSKKKTEPEEPPSREAPAKIAKWLESSRLECAMKRVAFN